MKLVSLILLMGIYCTASSQVLIQTDNHPVPAGLETVQVEALYSDSLSASFLIWIQTKVPAHYHASHTETIYVLEGSGDMLLENKKFTIQAGDFLVIPVGQIHSVASTGTTPLKVLSIQSPYFDGSDRVWVNN